MSYNNFNQFCCDEKKSCREERKEQTHTHEYIGSTRFAEEDDDRHNHRFAGVTGEAIRTDCSHVHKLITNTDFFGHFHEICMITGPAIPVGNGKHIHLVKGRTTMEDGHVHEYIFATLIECPAG